MAGCAAKDAASCRYHNRRMERMLPGMDLLLDAYALVDCGMARAIDHRGQKPACGAGCDHCCTQPIPLTPLEIVGLRLFVQQEALPHEYAALSAACARFHGQKAALGATCPFLRDRCCAVYPVRPMACRRYIVYGQPCAQGEDPTQTRPHDVLRPGQDFLQAALRHTLPWYRERYTLPEQVSTAEAQAFFRSVTTILQAVPWAKYLAQQGEAANISDLPGQA
ncbi:YkgJ family cysteine cluster protein [Desulfovibrio desulfuricans]|uniref:YkgJ family cysteine cluster protein n=1 Tax=Desulfovibrio desulfuricans TaxID=876 RepID=UPI0035B15BA4